MQCKRFVLHLPRGAIHLVSPVVRVLVCACVCLCVPVCACVCLCVLVCACVRLCACVCALCSKLLSHESMASKKLANLKMYMHLFPEYQYVWFGDSGQVRASGLVDMCTDKRGVLRAPAVLSTVLWFRLLPGGHHRWQRAHQGVSKSEHAATAGVHSRCGACSRVGLKPASFPIHRFCLRSTRVAAPCLD